MKRSARKTTDLSPRLADVHTNGIDWKTRTVYIVGALDDEKAYQYIPGIRMLDESPGDIKVMIMSPGGEEGGGFAIFDTLRTLRNRVITIGFGDVYSIAGLIFQAGDERLMAAHAQYMIHNGSINLAGGDVDTDSIKILAQEADRNNHRYHEAISVRSGTLLEDVEDWCTEEKYFSAHEAVLVGLADRVIESWKDVT